MIKFIPSNNNHGFYKNKSINRLADISLEHLSDELFNDIILLIKYRKIKYIDRIINLYKSKNEEYSEIYDELKSLFHLIYDNKQCDNLRGLFLELLIYKGLSKKYKMSKYKWDIYLDGFVSVNGIKSKRTVDICLLFEDNGLIGECKISHLFFEAHDIQNLNQIFHCSEKKLKPYIISLADLDMLQDELFNIVKDETNIWCNLENIELISVRDNISSFLI